MLLSSYLDTRCTLVVEMDQNDNFEDFDFIVGILTKECRFCWHF